MAIYKFKNRYEQTETLFVAKLMTILAFMGFGKKSGFLAAEWFIRKHNLCFFLRI